MRELSEIIGELHNINEQIVEKDNMIDQMNGIITLVTQLLADVDFIKSEIFLDMRFKYINQIDEQIKKLSQSHVTIEPENIVAKSEKKKHFTREEVRAPIQTDIFEAPRCRQTFRRKKQTTSTEEKKTDNKYVSFTYNDTLYYINTLGKDGEYTIHDENNVLVGHLKDDVITLLCDHNLDHCITINLRTITQTPAQTYLFGVYALESKREK